MKSPPPPCAIWKNENWYCSLYCKSASHVIAYLFYKLDAITGRAPCLSLLSIFVLQYSIWIDIAGEFILSCCLCVIDLRGCRSRPPPLCSMPTWRVDKVTYSQMIDIFIRRRECLKTLSAGIYLKRGILRPNTRYAQTHPSRVGRGPGLGPFALSVSLKGGAWRRWQDVTEGKKTWACSSWHN